MLKKLLRFIWLLLGGLLGVGAALSVLKLLKDYFSYDLANKYSPFLIALLVTMAGILFAVIAFLTSKGLIDWMLKKLQNFEKKLKEMPIKDMLLGVFGLILGLLLAFLIGQGAALIGGILSIAINVFLYVVFGILGVRVALSRRDEFGFSFLRRSKRGSIDFSEETSAYPAKILDTCVIIDGRIVDICATGFIEGKLIVPKFILSELRRIADSDDALKRNRGRKGLDILTRLQEQMGSDLMIDETDFEDIAEVDEKVIKLALDTGYTIITNDFNLNKLAIVQGIKILNINELSNAVKPVMMAGEEMLTLITKEGKEPTQGIGYLDDGTMIVVEGGRRYLNETVAVQVTSVLQTAAGRMIFAKIKD